MAFVLTDRGETNSDYGAQVQDVGDTFTPAEDDVIVVISFNFATTAYSGVTGWSATFVEIETLIGAGRAFNIWAGRIGASPPSDSATIDFGFSSPTHRTIVLQIAGASSTATMGLGAGNVFIQSVETSSYDPASPLAIGTLNAFASSTNLPLLCGFGGTQGVPSGWSTGAINTAENLIALFKTSEDVTHELVEKAAGDFDYTQIYGIGFEVAEEDAGVTVNVPAGALTLTGQAPVAALGPFTIDIPAGALSLTGLAPTASTGAAVTVDVPTGTLSLSGFAPSAILTDNIIVNIPAGSMSLTGQVPVLAFGPLSVDVPTGSLSLTGFAPSITAEGIIWTVQPDEVTSWAAQANISTTWTVQ